MSKRDIQTVAELAGHLAVRGTGVMFKPPKAAVDALKLQRLGRSASTNAVHWCNGTKDQAKCIAANVRYLAQATEILKPYGLKAKVGGDPRGYCLHILGLPGNTLGGDEEGYGI